MDEVIINNDDYYHITKVMRMKVNDYVYLCDCHNSYIAQIKEITKTEVILTVTSTLDEKKELPVLEDITKHKWYLYLIILIIIKNIFFI